MHTKEDVGVPAMQEKKPVYNGYEERYVTGKELKELFTGRYLATGRHHAVIRGIFISDYLDLLGMEDAEKYRIFINEHFCRVMDSESDKLISFFGHNSLEKVDLVIDPLIDLSDIHSEKVCPECGARMKFKQGKYGEFLGCSRYPECKHSAKIPIIGIVN